MGQASTAEGSSSSAAAAAGAANSVNRVSVSSRGVHFPNEGNAADEKSQGAVPDSQSSQVNPSSLCYLKRSGLK